MFFYTFPTSLVTLLVHCFLADSLIISLSSEFERGNCGAFQIIRVQDTVEQKNNNIKE